MRLVLGSGPHWPKAEGDHFVDIRPFENVDTVHDLNVTPWPFDDNSADHISAMHVVEHLKDLVSFMNECHRILKPGGYLYLETPHVGRDLELEFAGPTHIRCYTLYSFRNYFSPDGVKRFGYTDKAWNLFLLQERDNCIIGEFNPLK